MSRVLVAGATGAIGGLVAHELAGRGATLALSGRDAAALTRVAAATGAAVAVAVAADHTGAGEPERVVAEAHAALGGLDAVVCTIGVVAFGPARVVDVRPPHLATGLETRAIAGAAPRLPEGRDPSDWARRVADAIADRSGTEVGPEG